MAFSEITGTEAVGTTEHSLATDTSYDTADAQTDDGIVQVRLDLSDMVAGDILQIRGYEKARSGDTQRVFFEEILRGVQPQDVYHLPAFMLMHGWDFTLDALAGTVTVNWSLMRFPATIVEISGTEAVGTTEHSLATDTSYDTSDAQTNEGLVQPWLDLDDLIAADILQIRGYEKVRSGDTQRIFFEQCLADDLGTAGPLWTAPMVFLKHGWDWTADALAGTVTVNWSLRRIAS